VVEWFGWQDAEVPDRMREALVMELLRRHVISQGKAAALLKVSRWDIFDVMGRYQVPAIDLTTEELKQELAKETDFSARRCKLALARGSARSPMKAHTIQALRNSHWTNDVSS
jgi:predicted HTH domain antitoxin